MRRLFHQGFTVIELVLVLAVIAVLLALVFSARSGVKQNQRNTERQRDIQELRDGLEGYFAANNHYPTLQELNDDAWRKMHLKALQPEVFQDPSGNGSRLAAKAKAKIYSYAVTSASGTPCGSAAAPCTQYSLSASLEGGGTYTKNNLN